MDDNPDLPGLARAEDRFQDAVRAGYADVLALCLHEDLLMTTAAGEPLGRQEYLEGHRSGAVRVDALEELDRRLLVVGGTGVGLVLARFVGREHDHPFDVVLQHTRTWSFYNGWRVVGSHASEAHRVHGPGGMPGL